MVYRQPFPGPGLGVRCLGAITRDRLECVRESDAILREEFDKNLEYIKQNMIMENNLLSWRIENGENVGFFVKNIETMAFFFV